MGRRGVPRGGGVQHVYFIQGADGGLIKIGCTVDVKVRRAQFQSYSPIRLVVLGEIKAAGRDEEQRLHREFASARAHGEWFHPTPELLAYIDEHSDKPPPNPPNPWHHFGYGYLAEQAAAKAVG